MSEKTSWWGWVIVAAFIAAVIYLSVFAPASERRYDDDREIDTNGGWASPVTAPNLAVLG